jgi:hypothetical protein
MEKKSGSALNQSPLRAQSESIHEQGQRRDYFSNTAAVVCGIEIRDAEAFEFGGLVADSLHDFRSDEWLVIFDLSDAIMSHL